MIRLVTSAIATSVQDQGRRGGRMLGFARSGAMDPASLALTNRAAGTYWDAAGLEFGPGLLVVEITAPGKVAFGGAPRPGAPWWQTIEVNPGDRFELGPPTEGMWSYLAVAGGIDAPVVLGSRSASAREGIGSWLSPGTELEAGSQVADTAAIDPLPMAGEVRVYGELSGEWTVGNRVDRMGYQLEGRALPGGRSDLRSEPLLPGCIQVPPNGLPIVLMVECPTVGGYTLAGVVHSDDLRLVAQTRPGETLRLVAP